MPKIIYMNSESKPVEGSLGIDDVKAAQARDVSLTAYMNSKYPGHNPEYGTVVRQATAGQGVYLKSDPANGIQASTISVALGNTPPNVATLASTNSTSAGVPIVAPTQNSEDTSLVNRILFGENVLTIVEEHILDRRDDMIGQAMERLVAVRQAFPNGTFTQPLINTTDAQDVEGMYGASTQNTRPTSMVGISLSESSMRIPSYSIGVEITDQARNIVGLDLLTTIIGAHAKGLRVQMLYKDIARIMNGNPMVTGDAPLPTFTATSLDATILNVPMALTDLAWYKFIMDDTMVNGYDMILCGKEEYRSIINRTGRPTNPLGGYANNAFTTLDPTVMNLAAIGVPQVLILKDGTLPAGTIVAIDSSTALGEAVDSSANYQGTEHDQIIRSSQFRWDWSRLLYKLSTGAATNAFRVMTLT